MLYTRTTIISLVLGARLGVCRLCNVMISLVYMQRKRLPGHDGRKGLYTGELSDGRMNPSLDTLV